MTTRTILSVALASATAAALAAGLAPTTAGAAPPASSPSSPSALAARTTAPSYEPPPIEWGPCDDPTLDFYEAECGTLVVPRDYAKPEGRTLRLAVSRVLHTTEESKGVMLTNPGGPGGAGRVFSVLQTFVPDGAGEAYDWIGMDPRGIGESRPLLSCTSEYLDGDRPPYRPTTRGIYNDWIERSVGYAQECKRSGTSRLLRHMRTTDIVQDFESLRKALGAPRINFYGFSYGTYLGQVYATTYPNKVDRMVWDGVIGPDPDRIWYAANQDQDVAFERAIDVFFDWVAEHDDVYGLGSTSAEVERGYYRPLRQLDREAAEGLLGGSELTDVLTQAAYYVYGWVDIADVWSTLVNDGDAGPMIALAGVSEETPPPSADNGTVGYLATTCTDGPWPTQGRTDRDNWRLDQDYPFLTWSNAWFNGPCPYWPVGSSTPVRVRDRADLEVLMIGETLDAATPFADALSSRALFRSSRLVEGRNGSTHSGSLSGVACTDDTIARYLTDGTLPPRRSGNRADKVCPPVPAPEPEQAEGRGVGGGAGLPTALREALEAAQQPGLLR